MKSKLILAAAVLLITSCSMEDRGPVNSASTPKLRWVKIGGFDDHFIDTKSISVEPNYIRSSWVKWVHEEGNLVMHVEMDCLARKVRTNIIDIHRKIEKVTDKQDNLDEMKAVVELMETKWMYFRPESMHEGIHDIVCSKGQLPEQIQ